MPSDTPERALSSEEVEAIRAQAREAIARAGITAAEASRESGITYATFAAWLAGTYNGRNDRIATQADRWLKSRVERAETLAVAPVAPGFVATSTAEGIIMVLRQAKWMPDFAVVTGPPGTGKTMAATRFARETPHVIMITAHPSLNSPRHVLKELAVALRAPFTSMLQLVQAEIVRRVAGLNALIIVDEAQHLTSPGLDQLRSIHDAAECGVALLGNASMFGRLEGGSRSTEFAQLFSRVGVRLRATPKQADVDAIIGAWGVEDAKQRGFLRMVAKKPGALRGMSKTLQMAHLMAAGAREPLALHHLRMAFEQLTDTKLEGEAA